MIKNLIRKQMLIFIAILSCIAILLGCIISFTGINNYSSTYINQNLYIDANFDYIIPSPGKSQITTLNSESFIDNVCPYYTSTLDISFNSKVVKSSIYFVDNISDLSNSPFIESRVLSSKTEETNDVAFIDYVFSQFYGIKLGDTITLGSKNYKITKIYKPNSLTTNGCVVICWDNILKTELNSLESNYSGAWLKCNDKTQCENFLKNSYVPEGRIRAQATSETNEQYQQYLDSFYNNDFYKEVTDIGANREIANAKINDLTKLVKIEQIVANIILILTAFAGMYYIYFSNKKKAQYKKAIQSNTSNLKLLRKDIVLKSIIIPIICHVLAFITMLSLKLLLGYFIDTYLILQISIIFGVMLALSCITLFVFNILLFNKSYKIVTSKR